MLGFAKQGNELVVRVQFPAGALQKFIKSILQKISFNAGVAKRSNVLASGASGLVPSGVRILPPAHLSLEKKAVPKKGLGKESPAFKKISVRLPFGALPAVFALQPFALQPFALPAQTCLFPLSGQSYPAPSFPGLALEPFPFQHPLSAQACAFS